MAENIFQFPSSTSYCVPRRIQLPTSLFKVDFLIDEVANLEVGPELVKYGLDLADQQFASFFIVNSKVDVADGRLSLYRRNGKVLENGKLRSQICRSLCEVRSERFAP